MARTKQTTRVAGKQPPKAPKQQLSSASALSVDMTANQQPMFGHFIMYSPNTNIITPTSNNEQNSMQFNFFSIKPKYLTQRCATARTKTKQRFKNSLFKALSTKPRST